MSFKKNINVKYGTESDIDIRENYTNHNPLYFYYEIPSPNILELCAVASLI